LTGGTLAGTYNCLKLSQCKTATHNRPANLFPDSDPDPAFLSLTFKTSTKKNVQKNFSAYYLLKAHLPNFSKIKCPKEVTKQ
jgi:hypothetical protein